MTKLRFDAATQIVLSALIAEIDAQLTQATIAANAAHRLVKRGKVAAALQTLMDAEHPMHEALDLFRASITLRSHLLNVRHSGKQSQ